MSRHSQPSTAERVEDSPRIATQELHDALESGGEAKNYYAWLTHTFAPYLRGQVMEHGAGSGTLSFALLESGVTPIILNEPNDRLAAMLTERFRDRNDVSIFQGTLDDYLADVGPNSLDGIVSSNVLEHIQDDEGCLATMRKLIRPGGRLALYVPARPELYCNLDRVVGHHRRYRRAELKQKLVAAGFEVERLQYRNLLAALPWLWIRISNKQHVPSGNVKLYDKYVFPIVRTLEDIFPPIYGLNLLAVAT